MRILSRILVAAVLITVTGCSSNRPPAGPRGERDLLTYEQIAATNYTDAYQVVSALRSNWMNNRGTDTILGSPTQVLVYLDDARYGGVEALRNIPVSAISYIRHYDGIAATARWGLDHGAGVIYVSTRP
jgi:hypothetical protein